MFERIIREIQKMNVNRRMNEKETVAAMRYSLFMHNWVSLYELIALSNDSKASS